MKFSFSFLKHDRFAMVSSLARVTFRVSFIVLLLLLLIEYIEPGFAANWFHPLWLLPVVLLSVILSFRSDN